MDAPELSVYGEAKGEYTRQLCGFLVPSLESYFLELLETAKGQAPSPQKALWHFQTLLQGIPDWNQDKVLRETDTLQKDCRCDYLEELLTAVFIAHTKVLSAIRLNTKQKKLQITIPKLDHFLHRVLSDCARQLWTNAFLFAETNSIERQKNLRQVSSLLNDSVLNAIRGMLPVKSILREYLHDDEEETSAASGGGAEEEEEKQETKSQEETAKDEVNQEATATQEEATTTQEEATTTQEEATATQEEATATQEEATVTQEEATVTQEEATPAQEEATTNTQKENKAPVINIDTKPSVSFSQEHIFFDSNSLEANEIQDIPFAEAENRDDYEDELEELNITDEELPMDAEEFPDL